jgi:hypothetical protein
MGALTPAVISLDITARESLTMSDLLVRDLPESVVAALDAHAARLGLSRSEYVRRRLTDDARRAGGAVTVDDLDWFSQTFSNLADDDVMRRAWD